MKNLIQTISRRLVSFLALLVLSSPSWAIELDEAVHALRIDKDDAVVLAPTPYHSISKPHRYYIDLSGAVLGAYLVGVDHGGDAFFRLELPAPR